MPATTTNLQIRKPVGTDAFEPRADIGKVADDLDGILGRVEGIVGDVDDAPAGIANSGRLVIVQDTGGPAYKAMSGHATIDKDGVLTLKANSVGRTQLADDAVGGDELDEESVGLTHLVAAVAAALVPVGSLLATGRATAPDTNWLICDGASYLRTDHADLFAAIGTTYGSVDGTHFNVPDFRGRVPVGVDGAANRLTANDALGNSGGEEKHTLSIAEMPAHTHTELNTYVHGAATSYGFVVASDIPSNITDTNNTGSTGGGGAHNNMQPYQIVNWMIRR